MNEIGMKDQQQFAMIGIKPVHWSTATPIGEIFANHLIMQACRTLIRIALEIHKCKLRKQDAKILKHLRLGVKT